MLPVFLVARQLLTWWPGSLTSPHSEGRWGRRREARGILPNTNIKKGKDLSFRKEKKERKTNKQEFVL